MQIETKGSGFLMQIHKNDKSVTKTIDTIASDVVKYMVASGLTLCTAESCTGGMVSQYITSVAGASAMFLGGVCSYTEEIKQKILGVKKETLDRYTVYSEQVASEMSAGAQRLFASDCAVGITGIAGPGGVGDKPAGTVYISARVHGREKVCTLKVFEQYEDPDRETVRRVSALTALQMLLEICKEADDKDK